ncbi:MAG: hypothetical protein CUN55_20640 [Phototrophicales bacterium]|nr:MAG: hypothetical protein CUN55_20640 [Phototrophicales bacterium]
MYEGYLRFNEKVNPWDLLMWFCGANAALEGMAPYEFVAEHPEKVIDALNYTFDPMGAYPDEKIVWPPKQQ